VRLIIGILLTRGLVAQAQPVAVDPRAREPEREPRRVEPEPTLEPEPLSAADVRDAPLPGFEHGRVGPIDDGDTTARKVGRALLLVPRLPVELVAQPVRGFLYADERYDVIDNVIELFVTDDRRIAIFPTAAFGSGFGLNAGVQGRFTDLLREDERLKLEAGFGGRYNSYAGIDLDFGDLVPRPFSLSIEARYEDRMKERFFGLGNGDEITPVAPLDPLTDELAADSRFQEEVWRVTPALRLQLPHHFAIVATGNLATKSFSEADEGATTGDIPIDEAFMTSRIPGFESGTEFLYGELELGWDTRRREQWDIFGIRSSGSVAVAFAGLQHALDDEVSFGRFGVDLQHYLHLTAGPRALELRAYGELVTGDRDEVPFSELPSLGGDYMLRGYETDRFRDRIAVVGQVSYRWRAARWVTPVIFTDVGRVYSSLDDLSLDNLRVGFGGGLDVFSKSTGMMFRGGVGSSIDGGVNVYLSLNPAYDTRPRVSR